MFDADARDEIVKIAARLRLEPAILMAVAQVESGGRSFARVNGRNEPLIRFEGHYFDRLTKGKTREKARKAGLAHPRAGAVKNPRSQKARWALLQKAIEIDRPAALSSVSWGVGQVMGAHWNWLGYASIEALVTEARRGSAGQVALMARFIDKAGLADKLRIQDWAGFARHYNGPGYRKNRYDVKLANAYARYEKKTPDPEWLAPDVRRLKLGSKGDAVAELQKLLQKWGLRIRADGLFGRLTNRQVRVVQKFHDLPASGTTDSRFWKKLRDESVRWRKPERPPVKPPKSLVNLKTRGLTAIAGAVSRLALFLWRRFT